MADYSYNILDLSWTWCKTNYDIPFNVYYIQIEIPVALKADDHVIISNFSFSIPYNTCLWISALATSTQGDLKYIGYVKYNADSKVFTTSAYGQGRTFQVGLNTVDAPSQVLSVNNNAYGVPAFAGTVFVDSSKNKYYANPGFNNYEYLNREREISGVQALDYASVPSADATSVFPPPSIIVQTITKPCRMTVETINSNALISFYKGPPIDLNDPNPGDGDSHGGGGGGSDNLGGDTVEDTGVPAIDATSSGLMTLYNPTPEELQALGKFLWSDGLDLNSFKKLFNNPFDTLLGLSIVPIVPRTSGSKDIMFGNLDSGVSAKVISNQFVPAVDMGTISLNEVWNGALDYSPFTSASVYLPFIGFRELNIQDIMNSDIKLQYKFDVLTGGCIAELYVNHHKTGNKSENNSKFSWNANAGLLATFEGQCSVNIPLASQDYTNTIRAMIGAVGMVGGAAASIATGNPALGVAALSVGTANSAIQATTPTVERSGHLSSSNSLMANLQPFLTVTRPHQCKPSNYYKLRGVPSQVYVSKLSSLSTSGHNYYVQVAEIPDIKVAGATDVEITEIKQLLKEGVVL